jgi:protein ERP2
MNNILPNLSAFLFLFYLNSVNCLQSELSVLIEPGRKECFHQYLTKDLNIETDYQVIQGGDLDISYWIGSPSNRVLYTDLRKQGGQFNFKTDEDGEYRFCFDNSFSRIVNKQVFFFLSTNDQYVDPHFRPTSLADHMAQLNKDNLGELENKLENFRQLFHRVYGHLERAQRLQSTVRTYELIDRGIMENNFEKVNFWSIVNLVIMVLVAFIQVYMIRSLFEDKSKIGRVLRGESRSTEKSRSYT